MELCRSGAYQWEYADYATFSELAAEASLDPLVQGVAAELAFRMGLTFDEQVSKLPL